MVTVCRKWISHRKPIRISPSIRRSVQGMHRPVGFLADGFPYIGRRDQDDQPASGLEIPLGNPIWKSHGSERIIMEANDGGNIWKHYRTKWIYIKYIKLIWIEERYALSWVMSSTLSARSMPSSMFWSLGSRTKIHIIAIKQPGQSMRATCFISFLQISWRRLDDLGSWGHHPLHHTGDGWAGRMFSHRSCHRHILSTGN